jgi:hypothetical protein
MLLQLADRVDMLGMSASRRLPNPRTKADKPSHEPPLSHTRQFVVAG